MAAGFEPRAIRTCILVLLSLFRERVGGFEVANTGEEKLCGGFCV